MHIVGKNCSAVCCNRSMALDALVEVQTIVTRPTLFMSKYHIYVEKS